VAARILTRHDPASTKSRLRRADTSRC